MEKIESFLLDETVARLPFYVELAGITFPTPNYDILRESAEIYVLEYVISGSGTVEVDGQVFHPTAGDVYLLPRGSRQHYYASREDPFHKIWMNVGGDLCPQLLRLYGLSGKYHFEGIDLRQQFERFLDICRDRSTDQAEQWDRCSRIFLEIVQGLSRHIAQKPVTNACAAQARDFCDRSLYRKIAVRDVAKHVGLSVSQLNRLFRLSYDCTVYAYILSGKISIAKTLLSGTSMPVSEIAFLLKFADEHYFTNIFKQKTGLTPTQYRKGS